MARIHTMEDDITFERVRHMPRRTRVCSMHRQLSWACQKEIQMYEKDTKVRTNNLERSKTAMQGRFRELVNVRKDLHKDTAGLFNRRGSCPAVLSGNNMKVGLFQQQNNFVNAEPKKDNSHLATDNDVVEQPKEIKEDRYKKLMPRSVSMFGKASETDGETKVTKQSAKSINANAMPTVHFERRQTMPAL